MVSPRDYAEIRRRDEGAGRGPAAFFGTNRERLLICNPLNEEIGLRAAEERGMRLVLDIHVPATGPRPRPWWAFWRRRVEEPVFYEVPSRLSGLRVR